MMTLENWLFNPAGLTPHGFCLLWTPGLIWLHALSDGIVGLSYFTIPFVLLTISQCRPDFALRPLLSLFAAFILLCGVGHWMDVLTLWVPVYGLAGVIKAAIALVSVLTAFTLWRLMPMALQWPSPEQLNKVTSDMQALREAEARAASIAGETSRTRDRLAEELSRRQAAERQATESEERFRLVLQSVVDEGLYLLDAEGNVETWNPGAVRIKGYAPEEVIGQNFALFFTPDDVARGEPQRLLSAAADNGRYDTQSWLIRKNGNRFLADVTLHAIRRSDGTLRGFVKVSRDITSRRAEEEQRAIIIEAAPNGMMIINESGTITLANSQAEKLFGYPSGALSGQPIEILVPEGFRLKHRDLQSKFTSGHDVGPMSPNREVIGRKRDGSPISIEVLLSPVATPRGRIVVAAVIDVTERLRLAKERETVVLRERLLAEASNAALEKFSRHLAKARDRAEQASREKSRFLAGMSHELRTPLNSILGYAQLLHQEGGLTEQQRQRVEAMQKAGKHLLEMMTCVLDLSQIESNHMVLRTSRVHVADVAQAALDVVRPAAEEKNLALRFEAPAGDSCSVTTDPTRLRQIILNLLGNAVKYTRQGFVAVRLTYPADRRMLRIEVADSGPGVALEHRMQIFGEFERVESAANKDIEGAGLGLALSAKLATRLGGSLAYEDNPGGGSVFLLDIPTETAPVPAQPALQVFVPDLAPAPPRPRSLRVLVVDDILMNRDIAASFLRGAGHQVTCAESGQEAIDAASRTDFDVIVMDIRMPEMSGLEAARRIRTIPGLRGSVPIVALTAHAFADQVSECHEAGMEFHLAKPFEAETLLTTVAKAAATQGQAPQASIRPPENESPPLPTEFNQGLFDQITGAMLPETAASFAETIAAMGNLLKQELSSTDTCDAAGEMSHKLAGTAGMFGFTRLSMLASAFEYSLQSGGRPTGEERQALVEGIDAMLEKLIFLKANFPVASADGADDIWVRGEISKKGDFLTPLGGHIGVHATRARRQRGGSDVQDGKGPGVLGMLDGKANAGRATQK